MKKLLSVLVSAAVGFLLAVVVLGPRPVAVGGPAGCTSKNGDVNADGKLDVSDAVMVLGHLFLGSPTQIPSLCGAPGGSGNLPATGQSTCWNIDLVDGGWTEVPCLEADCLGQDALDRAGCPTAGRFGDNGDGTVTDFCTGLMWQKDPSDLNGDGVADQVADTMVWCEAVKYCQDLVYAGYDDWRLPNARELQSLVDYGRSEPCIDPVFVGGPDYYWSSTTWHSTPTAAWGVGFNSGYVGVRNKAGDLDFSFNFVRAVRTGD